MEVDLPSGLVLAEGLQGHVARPRARDDEQRALPPSPTKVRRHGLKLTYTFCLGGLSFFLFTILTITGIYLMFFYRPAVDLSSATVYKDMQDLSQAITFGQLVRNMHRWAAHLMVLSVFLHMARVFYHGAYKPRASSTGSSASTCCRSRCCSFTGYLLPWTSSRSGRSPSERT